MFSAGTSPDNAVSNISKWAELFGISLPDILQKKIVDTWIFWVCLIGIILYSVIMIFVLIRKKRKKGGKLKKKTRAIYIKTYKGNIKIVNNKGGHYLVENNICHHIPDSPTFNYLGAYLGFSWGDSVPMPFDKMRKKFTMGGQIPSILGHCPQNKQKA